MDYTGKWKIKSTVRRNDNDEMEDKLLDDLIAECTDEDEKEDLLKQKTSYLEINPNGKLYAYMLLPDEFKGKTEQQVREETGMDNLILNGDYFTSEDDVLDWEMRGNDLYVKLKATGYTYDDDGNQVPIDPWTLFSSPDDEYVHFFLTTYEKM